MLDKETIIIELPSKVVKLTLTPFSTDIDTDELTKIQYHNIIGEILTCSTLLNRIGNLQAEMENILSEHKLDFDIFQAGLEKSIRQKLTFTGDPNKKGETKTEKPTIGEVETEVKLTPAYKAKKSHLFTIQKNLSYITSLYWSISDKCKKINTLTEKLKPEEFEKDIVEGSINGIMISLHKKAIK